MRALIWALNAAYKRLLKTDKASNPVIDTLELGRFLYPEFKITG